jgi:hypothetical protein
VYQKTGMDINPFFNSLQVNQKNRWVPGMMGRAALLVTDHYGIEGRFLGLFEWKKERSAFVDEMGTTFSINISDQSPIAFENGTQVLESYKMKYDSADLLFLWNWSPFFQKFFGVRGSIGPSYVYVQDSLVQNLVSAVDYKSYSISCKNNFVGGRVYGEIMGFPAPFIWGARGSFGVYGDVYRQNTDIAQTIPLIETYAYPISTSWCSTLLSGDFYLGLSIYDLVRLRAGFSGQILNYLGSATAQVGRSFDKNGVYKGNHFTFYGVFASIEVDLF